MPGASNDATSRRPIAATQRLRTLTVEARGEAFKIVQVAGMLLVCARQHGSCCCGWEEKGRQPFDTALWGDEWERRKIRNRLHLSFTGCLGPCAVGNTALLQLFGQSIWFKDLNDDADVPAVFDYVEQMLAAGRPLPPPDRLADKVYERFSPPPEDAGQLRLGTSADDSDAADDLDGLDPVCLMSADPATAPYTAAYAGRTICFCALECQQAFLANPTAYLTANDSPSSSTPSSPILEDSMAKDPVCGMDVNPETAQFKTEHEGQTYYFCAPGCRKAFEQDPKKYLSADYTPSM